MQRKHGFATCHVPIWARHEGESEGEELYVHPTELDAAFQSIILAYSYPYDGQLRIVHLPTTIERIRLNPALCGGQRMSDEEAPTDATVCANTDDQGFAGDCAVYSFRDKSSHAAIGWRA